MGFNSGGAIGIRNFDKLSIKNSTFRFNKADLPGAMPPSGGAIALQNSSIYISHCVFHNNEARHGGAILYFLDTRATTDNCLFFNNTSASYGGAVEIFTYCFPYLINCTFADNHAGMGGNSIDVHKSLPTITNSIMWNAELGSLESQVHIRSDSTGINVYNCDIQEGEAGFSGHANIGETVNMLQADPGFFGSGEYPYAFDTLSPCKDYGTLNTLYLPDGWVCPDVDLANNPRIEWGNIDLGAYETQLVTGTNEANIEEDNIVQDQFVFYPNPVTSNTKLSSGFSSDGKIRNCNEITWTMHTKLFCSLATWKTCE